MSQPLHMLILHPLHEQYQSLLTAAFPDLVIELASPETAASAISTAHIVVLWGHSNINHLWSQAPLLSWVHVLSVSMDNLDLPFLHDRQIIVTNSKGIQSIPVSEHVLFLMLAFARRFPQLMRQQQQKQWQTIPADEIHEKTLAIIGLGSLGRAIAKKAKGLGMHVLAIKQEMTNEIFVDRLYTQEQLTSMLSQADFVVLTYPPAEQEEGFFRLEHFQAMKSSAFFINISQGNAVSEADLLIALQDNLIAGAGLDVFEEEPLSANSPLWEMENVIVTPHVAANSPYYMERAIKLLSDNLCRFVQSGEMVNRAVSDK